MDGKSGFDKIKEEVGDIVHTAEEVGKEIWEDIKGIFDGKKGKDEQADTNTTGTTSSSNDTSSAGNSTEPSRRRFI